VKRILIACAFLIASTHSAWADDPAPTKQDLAAAKQAFDEGNALYKAGKLKEAVDKLQESYKLSHNAFLLYNIGHIYDQLGDSHMTLVFFKKFLTDAPANAPMRADVQKRVEQLEAEAAKPPEPAPVVEEEKPQTTVELKHQPLDSAPPGVPCDLTATVSDPALTVTLHYRSSGDVEFKELPMTKRNDELVAHIPAAAMVGSWVQYYIEVRDAEKKLVTRNGKSTSPNLLAIENSAQPHFFQDLVQPGESTTVKPQHEEGLHGSGLGAGGEQVDAVDTGPPFVRLKWVATGVAGAFLVTSLTSYLIAKQQHDDLISDSTACGTPPCRSYSADYDRPIEDRGARYDTVYKVTLGLGIASAGAAGYFWYRALTAKPKDSQTTTSWLVTPVLDQHTAGATAAVRF